MNVQLIQYLLVNGNAVFSKCYKDNCHFQQMSSEMS